MGILTLLIIIAALAALWWAISIQNWIASPFKEIMKAIIVIVAILVVFDAFGLLDLLNRRVPTVN